MARPTLIGHRKFRRLCRILELPPPHVLGHLEFLWRSCYESGDERVGDAIDVELAAGWTGADGVFARACFDVGFLDELEGGALAVHDLWDHAPEYVLKRAKREAEREERGETISQMRAAAGRRGAEAKHGKRLANGGRLPESGSKRLANGTTPTPAPSPAPQRRTVCVSSSTVDDVVDDRGPEPESTQTAGEGETGCNGGRDGPAGVAEVWRHYLDVALPRMLAMHGRPRAGPRVLTVAAESTIRRALAAGYSVADLKRALDNAVNDAWLMGVRPNTSPQLNVDAILAIRNGDRPLDQVAKLLDKTAQDSGFDTDHRNRLTAFERARSPPPPPTPVQVRAVIPGEDEPF